jgi:ABC-type glycerol-3-phosphate transport system substrate-binding protein
VSIEQEALGAMNGVNDSDRGSELDSDHGVVGPGAARFERGDFLRRGFAAAAGAGALLGAVPNAAARRALSSGRAAGITLSYMCWNPLDSGLGLARVQIAKAYHKLHPDVSVEFEVVPNATFLATEITRAKAHKLPDICVQSGLSWSSVFPAFQPLQKTSIKDGVKLRGWSGAVMSLTAPPNHGPYAAVPIGSVGTIFYYHKGNWAKAGLNPDRPPRTWPDFLAACAKLKAAGIAPIGISGGDSYTTWWMWNTMTMQFFPSAAAARQIATGAVKLNDSRLLQALQAVQQTYNNGYWNADYALKKFSDIEADFIAGKLGMVCGITASIVSWNVWDAKMGRDTYGVFSGPLLQGARAQASFEFPGFLLATPKNGRHLKQALDHIGYTASKAGQSILLRTGGLLPNRDDLDVETVTRSPGANAIRKIHATQPTAPAPQTYMNGAANGIALRNITTAVTSGNLTGFLNDLVQAQGS